MGISTWELTRAAGLTSFFLLFLSISSGLLISSKAANGKTSQLIQVFHRSTGWFALLFGFFHGMLLYIDHYQPFSLIEIFIPFMAKEHPTLNAFGTISLYIFALLFVSADVMKKIGFDLWKIIHGLALPGFILVCIHGIYLGTDTNEIWGSILYSASLAIVFSLLIVKLLLLKTKVKKSSST